MESPKTSLFLMGVVLCAALLFDQCGRSKGTHQEIEYNPDSAKVHIIPFTEAAKLITDFNRGKIELGRQLKDTAYLSKSFNMPVAEKFNRDAIAQLLNEKGATGLRIYLGRDSGLVKLVLVAVDDKGNDITGNFGKIMKFTTAATDPVAMEAGQRCPTLCSGSGTSTPVN